MKELQLNPAGIDLEISLPASKSISNRALILNALSYSPYDIQNLSDCDDTLTLLRVFNSNDTHFDVGGAGTAMRFLTAFLAKTVGEWELTGSERMKNRPIKILVDALNQLGGKIEYLEKEGFPPLKIYGSALLGGELALNGSVSSQYISALMMIAPYMMNGLKIRLEGNVVSKPYIWMTKGMMEDFGVKVDFTGKEIDIRPQTYRPVRYVVESDWSAASYWYELLFTAGKGKITLKGLRKNSLQGDSEIAAIFHRFGIRTKYKPNEVILTVEPENRPQTTLFEYDFTDIPDLAQTVVVSCCLNDVPFKFSGLQSLKIKETDRIDALIKETSKLGYVLHEPGEGQLAWLGEKTEPQNPIVISTYDDHRMAMSFAPAALRLPIAIEHPEVVSKSYPKFWEDIEKLKQP